jgi:membrane-associated phospholipid phosphatase
VTESRRVLWGGLGAAVATALSAALDPWVWREVAVPGIYETDWGRMLRVVGSLFFWLPVTAAIWLALRGAGDPNPKRAWRVFWGATLAGGVAEILKLLVRRERPAFADGEYVFRDFLDRTWSTSGLGFPSSHVMVAFGGAAVLARLFPGSGPVGYLLAAGCAFSRVASRAHFASDAVGGAVAGWLVGVVVWRMAQGRKGTMAQ